MNETNSWQDSAIDKIKDHLPEIAGLSLGALVGEKISMGVLEPKTNKLIENMARDQMTVGAALDRLKLIEDAYNKTGENPAGSGSLTSDDKAKAQRTLNDTRALINRDYPQLKIEPAISIAEDLFKIRTGIYPHEDNISPKTTLDIWKSALGNRGITETGLTHVYRNSIYSTTDRSSLISYPGQGVQVSEGAKLIQLGLDTKLPIAAEGTKFYYKAQFADTFTLADGTINKAGLRTAAIGLTSLVGLVGAYGIKKYYESK